MVGWRAAEHDRAAEQINVGLVRGLIEVFRAEGSVARPVLLFAGSVSQAHRQLSAYARHKQAAEELLMAATADGIVRGSVLRLSTMFSQGTDPTAQDGSVIAVMMRRALDGRPLTLWQNGTVRRDLLCVDDAARAFVAALDCADQLTGRHWPVGVGRTISVAELFEAIARTVATFTGKPPVPVISVKPPDQYLVTTNGLDSLCDPSAFRQVTGWTARIPLHEALEHLAASLLAPH